MPAVPFAYDSDAAAAVHRSWPREHPLPDRDPRRLVRGRAVIGSPPTSCCRQERSKRLPAVIYLHGSGGDRKQLVVPATWLASRHAIGLVITAPSATARAVPRAARQRPRLRRQARLEERDVIAVRRGIDLLRRRPDVDPSRIGYVGWSAGARSGAILAGVEPRLRTVVLMSGGATPISSYAARAPASLRPTIRRYLGDRRPAPLRTAAQPRPGCSCRTAGATRWCRASALDAHGSPRRPRARLFAGTTPITG